MFYLRLLFSPTEMFSRTLHKRLFLGSLLTAGHHIANWWSTPARWVNLPPDLKQTRRMYYKSQMMRNTLQKLPNWSKQWSMMEACLIVPWIRVTRSIYNLPMVGSLQIIWEEELLSCPSPLYMIVQRLERILLLCTKSRIEKVSTWGMIWEGAEWPVLTIHSRDRPLTTRGLPLIRMIAWTRAWTRAGANHPTTNWAVFPRPGTRRKSSMTVPSSERRLFKMMMNFEVFILQFNCLFIISKHFHWGQITVPTNRHYGHTKVYLNVFMCSFWIYLTDNYETVIGNCSIFQ